MTTVWNGEIGRRLADELATPKPRRWADPELEARMNAVGIDHDPGRRCQVSGCRRGVLAKGMCEMHYRRARRAA